MPTLETIGGVVGFLVYAYLLYRQNKIMEEQNDLMREQGGVALRIANERTWRDNHWPMLVMAALTLATWLAVGYHYYDRHNLPVLFEFDDPRVAPLAPAFGQDTPNSCHMTVNTYAQRLTDLKSDYRLAIACFVPDGTVDVLDMANLQISQLYDIKEPEVDARIVYSRAFNLYRSIRGEAGIRIALLAVPKGVEVTQFRTLRQARAMRVLIPELYGTFPAGGRKE